MTCKVGDKEGEASYQGLPEAPNDEIPPWNYRSLILKNINFFIICYWD